MKIRHIVIFVVMLIFLSGCLPGDGTSSSHSPAGFWLGFWHGFIIVISFIISLFSDTVVIYETNNNGGWYNLGFIFGIGISLNIPSSSRKE
ncbi:MULTISPECIES: hypothetical protein [Bacillus]|uniref:hypothetical protein n=1 Tax=Bacillus TaxID=1386 RepID=UPI000BB7BEAD|nr:MULTISPECIES: hypothetical protein [Bacillus]